MFLALDPRPFALDLSSPCGEEPVAAGAALGAKACPTLDLAGLLVEFANPHLLLDAAPLDEFAEASDRLLGGFFVSQRQLDHACSWIGSVWIVGGRRRDRCPAGPRLGTSYCSRSAARSSTAPKLSEVGQFGVFCILWEAAAATAAVAAKLPGRRGQSHFPRGLGTIGTVPGSFPIDLWERSLTAMSVSHHVKSESRANSASQTPPTGSGFCTLFAHTIFLW
jgi:hypothetical protein